MHVLPLEIQHNIFVLACTDGGRTSLALSLTSRSYCDAVRPVRLHSVAVRAFSDIEGVLQSYKRDEAELEASGSTLKTRVWHLLLSPEPNNADEDEKPDEDEDPHTASMVALLQLVGPTLRTLTYTAQIRFTGLRGICPMPKLEELTVFLNSPERQSQPLPGPAHRPASYPALRKLHIILLPEAVVPDLPGSWWAEAAPNVTDIRLTNVGRRDGGRGWVVSMIGTSDRVCYPRWRTWPDHQTEAGLWTHQQMETARNDRIRACAVFSSSPTRGRSKAIPGNAAACVRSMGTT